MLSPTIRRKGVKALYGVPMIHRGKVIGVAHIGSLTAPDFSEADKLLFRTVVSRATSAVVKAQVLADLRRTEAAQRFLAEASPVSRSPSITRPRWIPSRSSPCRALPTGAIVDLLEDGRVRRVSVVHADPAQAALAHELKIGHSVDQHAALGVGAVLRSGTTEWRGRLSDQELQAMARSPEHLGVLRRLKLELTSSCRFSRRAHSSARSRSSPSGIGGIRMGRCRRGRPGPSRGDGHRERAAVRRSAPRAMFGSRCWRPCRTTCAIR